MSALAGGGSKPTSRQSRRRGRARAAFALVLGLVFSCGSDAVGVDACREIEGARCRAAEACGEIANAESCERFYRDQCLHGMSVPEPSEREVEACVSALDLVAECARSDDDSAGCDDACEAVVTPESLQECAFLSEGEDDDDDDEEQGGQGGTAPEATDEPAAEGGSSGADQSAGTAGSETN